MNDLRKAAEMALEALEHVDRFDLNRRFCFDEEIDDLRTALAQNPLDIADRAYFAGKKDGIAETLAQPEQEPVAWVKEGKERVGFGRIEERKYVQFDQTLPVGTKLYTAPPSKHEPVKLKNLRDVHAAQGSDGTWNFDQYMCGLFNGLELALAIFENREPMYKKLAQPEQEPSMGLIASEWAGLGEPPNSRMDVVESIEPVAWRNAAIRLGEDLYSVGPNGYYDMTAKEWLDWALSVVTAPPSKPWVGLTAGAMSDIWFKTTGRDWVNEDTHVYGEAIEAALRSKNNG